MRSDYSNLLSFLVISTSLEYKLKLDFEFNIFFEVSYSTEAGNN